jgi:YVTN family beta-propeller protein
VRFCILGALEVWEDGRELELGAGRQRALLALLLLNANEVVSGDRLIDELWGERPPRSAAKVMQGYISQLRRALSAETILTRGSGYLLPAVDTDAVEFERLLDEARRQPPRNASRTLSAALALWRGPPLSGFEYEAWAQGEIARLEELRLIALEERIENELQVGEAARLVPELEALVAEQPLRERLRAQLMLALYRSGRQAEALEAYQSAREMLVDELGIEPGDALRNVHRAILAHDPELALAGEAVEAPRVRAHRASRGWIAVAVALAAVIAASLVALGRGSSAAAVGANSVAIIDPRTNHVVGDVPVGSGPDALAVGAGGVWVANGDDGTVTRIDPRTRRVVSTIGIGTDVSDVAVGYGSVWVADGNDGTLTRIDPSQNAVEATFRLGSSDALSPQPLYSVTTGDHRVWVTRGNRLLGLDPASGRVGLRVPVEPPVGLAERNGIVWVTTTVDRVVELSARTGAVTGSISLSDRGIAPVLTQGSLWMIVGNPGEAPGATKIWELDANTGSTTATAPEAFAVDLAVGANALWVACTDGRVMRLAAATGQAARTIRLGQQPSAVAYGAGLLWVAVQSATP